MFPEHFNKRKKKTYFLEFKNETIDFLLSSVLRQRGALFNIQRSRFNQTSKNENRFDVSISNMYLIVQCRDV